MTENRRVVARGWGGGRGGRNGELVVNKYRVSELPSDNVPEYNLSNVLSTTQLSSENGSNGTFSLLF
jgi:hypothetical protein